MPANERVVVPIGEPLEVTGKGVLPELKTDASPFFGASSFWAAKMTDFEEFAEKGTTGPTESTLRR